MKFKKIAQSFNLSQAANIISFSISLANCRDCYNPSGAKISLRPAEGELPSEEEIIHFSLMPNEIPLYNGEIKKFSFYFSHELKLIEGNYFLVIEPFNTPGEGAWSLVSPYSGGDLYSNGILWHWQNGRWVKSDNRDTFFNIKTVFTE